MIRNIHVLVLSLSFLVGSCGPAPVDKSRFMEPDRLYDILESNVRGHDELEFIVDIDHARLAEKAESPMPPAHVLIWSDPVLEAAILKHQPLAAIDLPLRALAYEDQDTGKAAVIANSFDYIENRYSLPEDKEIRARYDSNISRVMAGIPDESIAVFPSDDMPAPGLISIESPYDFRTTKARILDAINAQSDTTVFGEMDFTARSKQHGISLHPLHLILFGAPGPGGKVMASAPTLGLDGFCQKLLIRQDADGAVTVSFNDLSALAERQQVSGGIPLRVVNYRIKKTFTAALEEQDI